MSDSTARPGLLTRSATAWRRHPVLWTLFAAALALTVFFSGQAALRAFYWADPTHRDQAIAGWMTPRYIATSWAVPIGVMEQALGQKPEGIEGPPTLNRIAEARGMEIATLIAAIEAAIAAHRATQASPPAPDRGE